MSTPAAARRLTVPIAEFRGDTFVELLQWRGYVQRDVKLFTFLRDGERDEATLTYGELDRQARAIAARIRECARPGDRALLLSGSA